MPISLSEPQTTLPIEDQILEAIISGSLPTVPPDAAPLACASPNPKSEIPNPQSLARHFNLPLSKLLDILADPRTRFRIAAAQELRDLDFHQREQSARDKALTALESILDTTEDPIEKRRAATAILRRHSTKNPFWPRIPGGTATLRVASSLDDDLDEDTDETPPRTPLPPPEHPKWCQPARANLIRLLTRLQDNHNPEPDSGLSTLFLHKQQPKQLFGDELHDATNDYLEDPGEEAELTNFSCAILQPPDPTPDSAPNPNPNPNFASALLHTEHVTLHWPNHHRTVHFHFQATRNSPEAVLWKITDIDIGPKDTSSHDSS